MEKYIVDQSMLSFIPRSTYYLTLEEQVKAVESSWESLLELDRELFTLLMVLPGTHYAKGRMMHYLLSNSTGKKRSHHDMRIFGEIDELIEDHIILHNLRQMPMASALRSLMFLAGVDYAGRTLKKVNNKRSRRIVMNYIFDRDKKSLESMVVKFRSKLGKLLTHAFGQVDLYRLFRHFDTRPMTKYCRNIFTGDYFNYNLCLSTIAFVFGKYDDVTDLGGVVEDYMEMANAAKNKDVAVFTDILKKGSIPYEVAMGFKNTYKLDVSMEDIHSKGHKSEREKLKSKESAKKVGVDTEVDYEKQSVEDIMKYLYLKGVDEGVYDAEIERLLNILINKLESNELDIDFGRVGVIVDNSASMAGTETRKYHPIITAVILANQIPNVAKYSFSNVDAKDARLLIRPEGNTELWKCLLDVAEENVDTVIVISDGYENTVEGLFEHVYNSIRNNGKTFDLVHINPVYDSTVKGAKRLVNDIKPIEVTNASLFKSQYILNVLTSGEVVKVKALLKDMFNKQIGGNKYELITGK